MSEQRYFRIRLGEGAKYAQQCFDEGFIGGNWGFMDDLEVAFVRIGRNSTENSFLFF